MEQPNSLRLGERGEQFVVAFCPPISDREMVLIETTEPSPLALVEYPDDNNVELVYSQRDFSSHGDFYSHVKDAIRPLVQHTLDDNEIYLLPDNTPLHNELKGDYWEEMGSSL